MTMRSELSGLNETSSKLSAERAGLEGEIATLNERLRQAQSKQDRQAIAKVEAEIRSKHARLAALSDAL